MTQFITELMNDSWVCRTAPATPGLLKTKILYYFFSVTTLYKYDQKNYSGATWIQSEMLTALYGKQHGYI